MFSQQKDVERKSGTYAVIGADGGIDPYGLNAAPLIIQPQSYKLRVFFGPQFFYKTFDDAYDAIAAIVGPGIPQTLVYQTDGGRQQQRQARPLKIAHVVTVESYFYADFDLLWELQGSAWRDFVSNAQKVWGGTGLVWGAATGIWGIATTALSAVSTPATADMTGATAPDHGPIFTIYGPFGDLSAPGFQIVNISIAIPSPLGPQNPYFTISDTLLTSGDQYVIDCGQMDVTKNGANAFGALYVPDYQERWMWFNAGIVNNLLIRNLPGVAPQVGGRARIDFFKKYY